MTALRAAKLTARGAWAYLAEAWAGPESDLTVSGLCASLLDLRWHGLIDVDVMRLMRQHLRDHGPPVMRQNGYRWGPGDREGRARFCKAMAARLGGE